MNLQPRHGISEISPQQREKERGTLKDSENEKHDESGAGVNAGHPGAGLKDAPEPATGEAAESGATARPVERNREPETEAEKGKAAVEALRKMEAEASAFRNEARQLNLAAAELTATIDAQDKAIKAAQDDFRKAMEAVLDLTRRAHPDVPPSLIRGETLAEVAASLKSAQEIVGQVRALAGTAEAQNKAANAVPAGAPGRQPPAIESMSPREKIALGIRNGR
jgi:hypothetical protein